LAGECIQHRPPNRTRGFYWNPLEIASRPLLVEPKVAARHLQRTVRHTIATWASMFDNVALKLSGGLDSSIVAAAIASAKSNTRLHCLNFYSSHPGSDERRYARKVAQHFGLELREHEVDTHYSLHEGDRAPRSLFPYPWWQRDITEEVRQLRMLDEIKVQALFSGTGGDQVFFTGGGLPTAVDHFWHRPFATSVVRTAMNDAAILEVSVWRVLSYVRDYGLLRRACRLQSMFGSDHQPIMTSRYREKVLSDETLWHPLFRGDSGKAGVAPAKYIQAYDVAFATGIVHIPTPHPRTVTCIDPLLSQPIIELCLRIPLFLTTITGRDRGLARLAFADLLPNEVLYRRSKAVANDQFQSLVTKNLATLRKILLDGYLVSEQILDGERLRTVLSGQPHRIPCGVLDLLSYLSAEEWARKWDGGAAAAA
jgi:asparagine synthase (glutamine-hydrolysing)